jgi:hypothetical protein
VLASLAVALALAAPPCPLPARLGSGLPWKPSEQLGYDVDVMGVVQAGTLSLTAEPPGYQGRTAVLRARLQNTSVFAKIRKVNGLVLSFISTATLRPDRYREEAVEDGVHKATDSAVGKFAKSAEVQVTWENGEEKQVQSWPRRGELFDLLSAVYYLRAAALEPGQKVCLDLVANRRLWHLSGAVAAKKEKVETAAGVFDTLRLDGDAEAADGSEKKVIHLWLSADAARIPVAAVGEIDLGPVRAMLVRMGEGAVREGKPAE